MHWRLYHKSNTHSFFGITISKQESIALVALNINVKHSGKKDSHIMRNIVDFFIKKYGFE